MHLRDRAIVSGVGAVLLTAAALWIATRLGLSSLGPTGSAAVALILAGLGAGWLAHVAVARPLRRQLRDLAHRVRLWTPDAVRAPSADREPDLADLDRSVFERLAQLQVEVEGLRARAAWVTGMLQSSQEGIGLLDAQGRFTDVNDAFRGMFRLRGEPLGKRPLEAVPSAEVHLVVEEAQARGRSERAFTTASSDLVARASALADGWFVRVEDVTGRREAERSRTDFVANVSHELRTPLTAILGYLETVLQDADRLPDDLVPLLRIVERNSRRLRDLFEDLLRLHRIEARRRALPMALLRLRPILEEATAAARERAELHGQRFTLTCRNNLYARVNPEALTAIVSNLTHNASNYTADGGHVTVTARRVDRDVQIDVVDDGIGIGRAHHERIFERFYRVDAARSRREGGTGLGLAIVRHYALACGFHVSVLSERDVGSTFTVVLPDPG